MAKARDQARGNFAQLELIGEQCRATDTALERCADLSQQKRLFDLAVVDAGRHRSLAILFAAFALVVPGLIWAAYQLTRIVFRPDPANRQFDE